MNEYDQRQYNLMYKCLKGFEVGNVNLRVLISSLRGLINILQEPEDEWKTSFLCEWWTLEEIYSLALDKEQNQLSETDRNSVYEAIDNMKKLILHELSTEQDI